MNLQDRMKELQEMKQEFIFHESWIPEEQSPSWGDIAEVNAKAELLWDATDDGKELKDLEKLLGYDDSYGYAEQKNFD